MAERFVVYKINVQNSGDIIYTIEDTVLGLPFKYCFKTRKEAETVCARFNAKRKKPVKHSKRKETKQ